MLKVCLICIEYFGHGVYGGFGRATRTVARELSRRGVEVTVVVPQRQGGDGQRPLDEGYQVLEFPQRAFWRAQSLFRDSDADVFHSQDPSLSTWLAMQAMPDRAHIVTFRDTMEMHDWQVEFRHAGPRMAGILRYAFFVDNPLSTRAVQRADGLHSAAEFLASKAKRKYRLTREPEFLPTPVTIPSQVTKADQPTVCFIGRLHRRKHPERFLELANAFPHVRFICVGGTNEHDYEAQLRATYAGLPNVEMTGTIDQFDSDRLHRILAKSWVLVNTASREGLPNTFLEAAASRCAILSGVDPDGFASRFGYRVHSDFNFATGLATLLANDRWRPLGEKAYRYVAPVFGTEPAIERHLDAYNRAMNGKHTDSREALRQRLS